MSNYVRAIILTEISFFKESYNIRLLNKNNVLLKFRRKSILRRDYFADYLNDKYELVKSGNVGHTILKNGKVIAEWTDDKNFILEEQDKFTAFPEESFDMDLVVSLCLIVHFKNCQLRNPD